jgi:hypothetical protein
MQLRTNVFHISLLELALKNIKLNKDTEVEDKEEEWDIEEVLDSCITKG